METFYEYTGELFSIPEFRFTEFRAVEGRTIFGNAIVYGDISELPMGREMFMPRAFGDIAAPDTILHFQHERARPLARTNAGLTLTDSPERLEVAAEMPPTRDGDDALGLAKRGILRGFPTEFNSRRERYQGDTRIIESGSLPGLGLVDQPAYPQSVIMEVRAAGDGLRGEFKYNQDTITGESGKVRKQRFRPGAFTYAIEQPDREITLTLGDGSRQLATANGREGGRIGNRHPRRAPQGCYPAAGEDQWITLSVGDDSQWRSLCQVMEQPDLASEPRFATLLARRENHDALDKIIAAWTSGRDRYDTMHALQAVGIPSGPVLTGRDIHYDPHFKSRNFLERVQYPPERGMGERMFLSRPYKFSKSPLHIQGPSPAFGQHNEPALQDLLGVSEETYRQLVEDVVITTVPTTGEPSMVTPQAEALERGVIASWDPDYRERLGLAE